MDPLWIRRRGLDVDLWRTARTSTKSVNASLFEQREDVGRPTGQFAFYFSQHFQAGRVEKRAVRREFAFRLMQLELLTWKQFRVSHSIACGIRQKRHAAMAFGRHQFLLNLLLNQVG